MIDFTPYLALNWLILAIIIGLGLAIGGWLWATIVTALARKPTQ